MTRVASAANPVYDSRSCGEKSPEILPEITFHKSDETSVMGQEDKRITGMGLVLGMGDEKNGRSAKTFKEARAVVHITGGVEPLADRIYTYTVQPSSISCRNIPRGIGSRRFRDALKFRAINAAERERFEPSFRVREVTNSKGVDECREGRGETELSIFGWIIGRNPSSVVINITLNRTSQDESKIARIVVPSSDQAARPASFVPPPSQFVQKNTLYIQRVTFWESWEVTLKPGTFTAAARTSL
ncbi:hypothetical protein B0H16DRAFT_1781610 [Mycena metata]|uniref:Uncharacterized protein n=1 Tax=Mycena metata TaxID=1033252 RepID=A0AAD7HQ53_9AGAR|nr:hypothetical protein B0H16DRAFT_1781610 [Mycena metata]